MAFDDFQNNEPVIILNGRENLDKLYSDMTITDGQDASPDTFNVSNRDSVSRDVNLEAAITYLARSASLYTTSNTKFLSHCEGEGVDVISYIGPYTGESGIEASELFITDSNFLGAAYPQGKVRNMIDKTRVYNRYPCKGTETTSKNGWKMNLNGLVEATNVLISENAEQGYLKITTDGISGALSEGKVTFTSDKLDVIDYDGNIPDKFSAGFLLNSGNMITANTEVKFTINFFPDKTETSTSVGSFTATISNYAEYNNIVSFENITVPTEAKATAHPAFNITVDISFNGKSTPITLYLSKFMAQDGEVLYTWTETSRDESYLQYGTNASSVRTQSGIVDLENNDCVTLWYWSKFSETVTKAASKDIGPVTISWKGSTSEMTIGLTHPCKNEEGKAIGNNMNMRLAFNKNGVTTYADGTIELSRSNFDKYFLSALRFRKTTGLTPETTTITIEASIVVEGKVYTLSKSMTKAEFPLVSNTLNSGIIVVGKDVCIDSTMTSNNTIFTSRVTEIRYDAEWVNDLELYLASLGKKPFSYKQSTDSQITTKQKTTTEVIDAAGINLVTNPTGKYALIGWTQYNTGSNFIVSHTDPNMGNCFNYTGSPTSNVLIYSDPIPISANTLYSLRAFMKTRQGDSGTVVIGTRFSNSTTFDPTASMAEDMQATCSHTGQATYYSAQKASPSNATYAHVYMYVNAGASVSAQWSKIKLEQGSATFFTEDCGANYAIYF